TGWTRKHCSTGWLRRTWTSPRSSASSATRRRTSGVSRCSRRWTDSWADLVSAQFFLDDPVQLATFEATLHPRHHRLHHGAEIGCAVGHRRLNHGANLVFPELRG